MAIAGSGATRCHRITCSPEVTITTELHILRCLFLDGGNTTYAVLYGLHIPIQWVRARTTYLQSKLTRGTINQLEANIESD